MHFDHLLRASNSFNVKEHANKDAARVVRLAKEKIQRTCTQELEIKGNSDSIGVTVYIATPINPYDAQELLKRSELVIKMLYERDREREMDKGWWRARWKGNNIRRGKNFRGLSMWLRVEGKLNLEREKLEGKSYVHENVERTRHMCIHMCIICTCFSSRESWNNLLFYSRGSRNDEIKK